MNELKLIFALAHMLDEAMEDKVSGILIEDYIELLNASGVKVDLLKVMDKVADWLSENIEIKQTGESPRFEEFEYDDEGNFCTFFKIYVKHHRGNYSSRALDPDEYYGYDENGEVDTYVKSGSDLKDTGLLVEEKSCDQETVGYDDYYRSNENEVSLWYHVAISDSISFKKYFIDDIISNNTNESEFTNEADKVEDKVPGKDIRAFVDGMANEVVLLNENDSEDIAKMKAEIFDFIGKMKTKEDLEDFLRNNKAAMEGIRRNTTISLKIRKWLSRIWDVLCYVVKFGLFCIRNITSIAILAAVVFICIKFEVTPIEAITKAYQAAKIVYKAADITVSGAKKASDVYSTVLSTGEDIGWKIGEKVGQVIGNWL